MGTGREANKQWISYVFQHVLLSVVGSFNFGYSLSALNTTMLFVGLDFKWCPDSTRPAYSEPSCTAFTHYSTWVNVAVFVGAAFGCILSGLLTSLGRRVAMIYMHSCFILGFLLTTTSGGFASLLISRLVVGTAVGLSTVCVPMYLSEMAPKQKRGFYCVFHQLFITVGIFLAVLLGLSLGKPSNYKSGVFYSLPIKERILWRFIVGLPLVWTSLGVFLLLFFYKTETPHYLVLKNKIEEATTVLQKIYGQANVDRELDDIHSGLFENEKATVKLSLFRAIKSSVYQPVLIISFLLSVFQQFTGINVLVTASNKLFQAAKMENIATELSIGMTALNVVMTFPPIFFIDKLGRRTLMIIGTSGQFFALMIGMIFCFVNRHALYSQYIAVSMIFLYVFFFSVAYGPVLWVYLHEIFPSEIKQSAASFMSASNWIASALTIIPASYLLKDNVTWVFLIFSITGLIAVLIVVIFMKETKGLSIDKSPYIKLKSKALQGMNMS